MAKVVNLDKKGRIIIPKKIRERAKIRAPAKLLVLTKAPGHIEVVMVSEDLETSAKIASRKLKGWKEEEHKGEELLMGMKG